MQEIFLLGHILSIAGDVLRNPKLASAEDGFSFCRMLLSLCARIPKKISIDAKLMVRIAISYYMYVCRGGMLDADG
jgi:hypothetical protein